MADDAQRDGSRTNNLRGSSKIRARCSSSIRRVVEEA
jgi:hypothetical protein